MDMKDKAALVTGGSRGLGRALGGALAAAGARVVLVARGRADVEAAAADIRRAGGVAHAIAADVADKDATYAVAGRAAALVGPIDVLVNNASTLGPVPLRLVLDTDCEDLERALAVNVVGPLRLIKAVAGPMVLRGRGLVVNVSSDAAVQAYPRWGAYAASKAALDHMGRVLAVELEGTGVDVLAVDPGEMRTRMHAEAVPDADPATLADPARVAARIVALVQARGAAGAAPSGARVVIAVGEEARS